MRYNSDAGRNKKAVIAVAMLIGMIVGGCGANRPRWGYLPTPFGNPFPDPNNLGTHSSGFVVFTEAAGLVYTCRGGHIDLDHVRGNADCTKYLVKRISETLAKKSSGFSFNMTGEMSSHNINFTYPTNWELEPDKEKIINEIAMDTAPYLTMNATTWHEIMTWFGVHFLGFEPEFNSAFSWEDVYSNLVGVKLGIEAMKENDRTFDEAMTVLLYEALKEMGVRPKRVAIEASKSVEGKWYTGNLIPDMKMRHFDIGLNGTVTPVLIPNVEGCEECEPMKLAMPTTETLKRYGFSMTHEIKPNIFEEKKILYAASANGRIVPEIHFPILIEYMKKEAQGKGYSFAE